MAITRCFGQVGELVRLSVGAARRVHRPHVELAALLTEKTEALRHTGRNEALRYEEILARPAESTCPVPPRRTSPPTHHLRSRRAPLARREPACTRARCSWSTAAACATSSRASARMRRQRARLLTTTNSGSRPRSTLSMAPCGSCPGSSTAPKVVVCPASSCREPGSRTTRTALGVAWRMASCCAAGWRHRANLPPPDPDVRCLPGEDPFE